MSRGQALQVPPGVICKCVANHNPQTNKLLPWEMPTGTVMWVCPTTWYCINELHGLFVELGGEPEPKVMAPYPLFARRLVKLHWKQQEEATRGRNGAAAR